MDSNYKWGALSPIVAVLDSNKRCKELYGDVYSNFFFLRHIIVSQEWSDFDVLIVVFVDKWTKTIFYLNVISVKLKTKVFQQKDTKKTVKNVKKTEKCRLIKSQKILLALNDFKCWKHFNILPKKRVIICITNKNLWTFQKIYSYLLMFDISITGIIETF